MFDLKTTCCRVGDYLLSLNGRDLQGLSEVEVLNILRLLPRGIAHLEVSVLPSAGTQEKGECEFRRYLVV